MKRIAIFAGALLCLLVAGGVAAGSLHYGNTDDFFRRVRAEIAARQPHPKLAPTPLPVAVTKAPTALPIGTAVVPKATSHPVAGSSGAGAPEPALPAERSTSTPTEAPTRALPDATATPMAPTRPASTPTSAPRATALPATVEITELTHVWQTWNNCGPATLAMELSCFGLDTSQADIAAVLRPNPEDKNVSPDELAAFAEEQDLYTFSLVNGNAERLRALLAAGIPVLIETWHEPKPNDGMGHYRLLTGYDDAAQTWIAYDSYDATGVDPNKPYDGIRIPYDKLDPLWRVFNRPYIVIAPVDRSSEIDAIVGPDLYAEPMWLRALEDARVAVEAAPEDAFAWFNLGSDLTELGRYEEAAQAFDQARQIGLPWRMFWYQFGAFRAYYESGRNQEVIALADATLRTAKYVEELYYWRGRAQLAEGQVSDARASFQKALEMNNRYQPAIDALAGLPGQ